MWPRFVTTALGLWLMAAPAVLGYDGTPRTHDVIVGPLVANFAIVAMSGATRPLRWVNVVLGAWLLVAPWILSFPPTPRWNALVVGVLLVVFGALRGGAVTERFGGGWRAVLHGGHPPDAARGES